MDYTNKPKALYNQKLLDKVNMYHGKIMDYCLTPDRDEPGSRYNVACAVYKLFCEETRRAAMEANKENEDLINSFVGAPISRITRIKRERGMI